ncbi:hypothetical protein EVAR_62598_1 [Eumeta japonica]|uniref:Uncharacterized protein n=1 Tax=Eumeta variegata TaxID=151549 RepID=A0A4C1ZR27_EUMVA|nr:hypothetical protein EVAR_62598_1 [Eumeta japonica]
MAYRDTAVLLRTDVIYEMDEPTSYVSICTIGTRVGSSDEKMRLFAAFKPSGTPLCVQDIHFILNSLTATLISGRGDHISRSEPGDSLWRTPRAWATRCCDQILQRTPQPTHITALMYLT